MIKETEISIRSANKEDRAQLAHIIHFESYVHRHLDWRPPLDWIGHTPYIIAEKDTFKVLRKALLDLDMEAICKDSGFTPPSNNIESIIDEAIYKGGNWFVYGAGKPTEPPHFSTIRR